MKLTRKNLVMLCMTFISQYESDGKITPDQHYKHLTIYLEDTSNGLHSLEQDLLDYFEYYITNKGN